MYNYTITRFAYLPVFRILFAFGTFAGGILGLIMSLLAWDAASLLSGAFLGLLLGLSCGVGGLAFVLIFNILTPVVGGLPIYLEKTEQSSPPVPSETKEQIRPMDDR